MSKAYPERRVELDAYEEDIIDISNFYGSKYYDYHKMFSAKASTLLREHHVKVDWSKRDRDLFTLVAAGIQISVSEKNTVNHQEINSSRNDDRGDKYGRPKYFQDGKEICNNFNSIRGCTKRTCSFSHVCTKCRSPGHSQALCGKRPSATSSSNQTPPIDKETPKTSHLSAPHNDTNVSINDLIDKDLCSMTYVKIDDAIRLITNYGKGTKLCKFDIQNAFKICPVLPNQWPLFCFKWESLYYFYVRLSFGCRSSPKIFDNISTAICFIAEHNYKVKHILHLLDDFLTVDPPEFDAERTMALITMIFNRLNVPLAANKTMGPLTCIEYLGIVLDTDKLEARLPANKGKNCREGKEVKRRRTARVTDNGRTAALSQTEHDVVPPRTQITTSNASGPSTTFNSSVDLPNNEESYSQTINEQGTFQNFESNVNSVHEIASISNDLGNNVSCNIRQKILNGEYIDLGCLLSNPVPIDDNSNTLIIKDGVLQSKPKASTVKINSISQWTDAFLIFIDIYLSSHLGKARGLLKYMSNIRLGASRVPGLGWKRRGPRFAAGQPNNSSQRGSSANPRAAVRFQRPPFHGSFNR
ncbi:Hypothetical predicted protein [Mytilus galloprovincialis]|uniref:C3H1-type domain-containing protein n=1 Tax=Mytilus galloprovincialis TaxID=29158 RepID=A0A8B6DBK4_MYTGA|nr:Hypothetical predicted protein [Mytilus galloprovincialis]